MKINVYIPELFNKRDFIIGGVQTYLMSLLDILDEINSSYRIITISEEINDDLKINNSEVICLSKKNWLENNFNNNSVDLNIVMTSHFSPRNLKGKTIGIQHGVYWDRPFSNKVLKKVRLIEVFLNQYRNFQHCSKSLRFDKLVCVDTIFPAVASSIIQPFSWDKIEYIPNFSPKNNEEFREIEKINEIVFSRRFVEHRGSRILIDIILSLRAEGCDIPIKIFGSGPDEALIKKATENLKNVKMSKLDYDSRLDAFNMDSLVIVPTLSTEGTSLSCIEAMASGAIVLTTCVGGLSNIIINNHNGFLCKPQFQSIINELNCILGLPVNKLNSIRNNSFQSYRNSFSSVVWEKKWKTLLKEI
ncbi:putative Glycosyltransferase involved in cell wall bisynthesis [Vibrio chagasii]|nr:putative Glycosyltransferase involved in cell wall bisynthesis [Vibrio chagasii]CAH7176726.1 putative Glycosyltransferase involved in cell wall bisynthesis [Vibrio chagasii]CAH7244131.1 putative Glycosyltransferase involved in cell wall bisynthesis [Vibrio chagasii]CAH7376633.1 putative Glycosyltransferase involved in cell wall bisynthesis [Vibrio chagasii]